MDEHLLRAMAKNLRHRGPDGEGFQIIGGQAGFGHTRLLILDLAGSPQPMAPANGPMPIAYKGEACSCRPSRNQELRLWKLMGFEV